MLASIMNFFSSKKIQDEEQYVRLTYRSNITKILPTTYYQSDTGWGCMLRVTQMTLANLLYKKQQAKMQTILPLCWDNSDMPFSIQSLTKFSSSIYPHKKHFEWYTPCEAGFILKKALQNFNLTYSVNICNDNSLFLDQISTQKENIVVLVMSRIGLDKPQKDYLDALQQLMKMKYFFCMLGGTPRYAHLFFKQKNGYFGYLDPHETKKCEDEVEEVLQNVKQNIGKLQWIRRDKISSSMCIMFVFKKQEVENWWKELCSMKEKMGEKFFLYIDQIKPEVNSDDGIVEIVDLEEAIR